MSLRCDLVTTAEGFRSLESEWDALYAECDTTPFQSWAWLYSWWEHYGEGENELRIATVRDDGRLVAVLPFMLQKSRSMNRLLLIGNGPTSYLDVLVESGWEDAVSGVMDRVMSSIPGWHVADLQQLRDGAAAHAILGGYSGPSRVLDHEECLVLPALSWEEMVRRLRKSQRTQSRKTIRLVQDDGLAHRIVPAGEVEEAARTLVRLNREYWKRSWDRTSPDHWTPDFEEHIVSAAKRLTEKGLGAVSELRGEDGVVLSQLLLFGDDFTLDYIVAPNPDTLGRYSFNTLFIYFAMKVARENGSRNLGLMRGSEEYKWRWQPVIRRNERAVLGRNRARWTAYIWRCNLQARIAEYAATDSVSGWMKKLADVADQRRARKAWQNAPPEIFHRFGLEDVRREEPR